MKRNLIYISLAAVVGLFLGYLLFNDSDSNQLEHAEAHGEEAQEQMWTCSMHPQIMQPEPGDCPICGMDLIPASAGAEGLAADQFKMTKNAMALANIQTSSVGGHSIGENSLKLSGKIRENEEANSVQAAYFEGRIEKLNINFTGEPVRKGQLLATIYSPTLVAAQQELLTSANLKDSQPALYNAVRNKLKLWKLSEKQIDQIEESGKVNEHVPIYATVSGTVTEKLVQVGDYVKQGQPLFKIADLNTVWAVFDAYENQISSLNVGQEVKIKANAYPDREFNAKIMFVDPRLNSSTRTVTVRAVLDNKEELLKPGMFVAGDIQLMGKEGETVISIPESAVLWTGQRSLVYTKIGANEPVFQLREIRLGNSSNGNYTVLDGLENGEEIVTNGTFTVDAAAQLSGKKSMMNPSEDPHASEHGEHATNLDLEFPPSFEADFEKIIQSYLEMKDAFVASDAKLSGIAAEESLPLFKKLVQNKDLSKSAVDYLEELEDQFSTIAKSDDLEKQREQLITLSNNMISIASHLESLENPLYVQHCPMANTDRGASWLSLEKDIKNPYYGDRMLRCGSVIDSL